MQIKRVLISVFDKTGIVEFAGELEKLGVEIVASGGTYKVLSENGIKARKVEDITGFSELLGGRVKTLHPKVLSGILAVRDNAEHLEDVKKLGIELIDMVVVNFYPFSENTGKGDAVELIDIGGPSLVRAAAKNYKYVVPVVKPEFYSEIISELKNTGEISHKTRLKLAIEAFKYTAIYDAKIANHFAGSLNGLPDVFIVAGSKVKDLRYGENPHQRGAIYGDFFKYFEKLHGKELSYNNVIDIVSAVSIVCEFEEPACAIVKHTNPCGVAISTEIKSAYEKALSTDPVSAYGGIVAFNRKVDLELAHKIDKIFTEVVVAPGFSDDAVEFFMRKKNRRIVKFNFSFTNKYVFTQIPGGFMLQEPDCVDFVSDLKVVTRRKPTEEEMRDLMFAWKVVKHVKSNAIVYAKDQKTVGIGAGQMSRVDASKLAVMKARQLGHSLDKSVVASDAFFPFPDGLLEAVKAGATAVIQPGGSIRDDEVIKAADEHNIAMVFTGTRHFKH